MPRVSVVIPTFNRLPLLRAAIDSVRTQTLDDWELIVVDDGSTDGTADYVNGLGDARIRLLASAHTGNVARARNAGARAASAPWLAFLDSDDVWLPRKLEVQLARMIDSGVRWSYTRYDHMDEAGNVVPAKGREWHEVSGRIAREIITSEAAVSIITVMVERQLFFGAGAFDETKGPVFREDLDLELRLALLAEVIAIDERLARVRVHGGRATRDLSGAAPFLATARVLDKFLSLNADRRSKRAAWRRRAWLHRRALAARIRQALERRARPIMQV